ncbi:hypothetical protein A0H81_14992 [Grifola frondosa]|uniref:Uncharacterized protein n=1 Tax=Grifola frondosa TaxID=5627 RepID=A0A1C7LJT7_GRIFR|nr:hypothetical protein A0H81_14992 [Grifola frondosa]
MFSTVSLLETKRPTLRPRLRIHFPVHSTNGHVGAATDNLNSYPLLIVGKVLAATGDGSLYNAQHRIFSTYFAPGKSFTFSIGTIWCVANLAQFTGQSTANAITQNLGSYAWALWISSVITLFSFLERAAAHGAYQGQRLQPLRDPPPPAHVLARRAVCGV